MSKNHEEEETKATGQSSNGLTTQRKETKTSKVQTSKVQP